MKRALLSFGSAALFLLGCGTTDTPDVDPPREVMVHLNINADDTKGASSRAITVVDVDTDKSYNFPLANLKVEGQPMHALLSPGRKAMWMTVGGDDKLGLRVVAVDLHWSKDGPKPKVAATAEVIAANTPNHGTTTTQQGHGPHFGKDDSIFYFSELDNFRIRAFNTKTNKLVGSAITNAVLKTPHGFYPNKSGTKAASTQYEFNGYAVGIWTLAGDGNATLEKTITLADSGFSGAFTHTAWWLDDNRFYTNATQDVGQGDNASRPSVWLIDVAAGTAKAVIKNGAGGILEGVSDTVVAAGKLYVAEGNVDKTDPPGHLSIWNISNPLAPTFVKRFSAGSGFPADFRDAHELDLTPDHKFVYVESFRSSHSIKIATADDSVAHTFDAANSKLSLSHGLHSGWTAADQ